MAKCKGCGKEVIWGMDPDGKRVPLDQPAPCYRISGSMPVDGTFFIERVPRVHVSHFSTCSHANDFSRKRKAAVAAEPAPRKTIVDEEG